MGGLRLQNENGVIMNLRSRTKGLDLNLGNVTGVTVTMGNPPWLGRVSCPAEPVHPSKIYQGK